MEPVQAAEIYMAKNVSRSDFIDWYSDLNNTDRVTALHRWWKVVGKKDKAKATTACEAVIVDVHYLKSLETAAEKRARKADTAKRSYERNRERVLARMKEYRKKRTPEDTRLSYLRNREKIKKRYQAKRAAKSAQNAESAQNAGSATTVSSTGSAQSD